VYNPLMNPEETDIVTRNIRVVNGVWMKPCSICQELLVVEKFSTKTTRTGKLTYKSACIQCSNLTIKKFRDGMKRTAVDQFGGCCFDCKRSYPLAVYDFHHLDSADKDIHLSRLLRKKRTSWNEMKHELDKCVLLCANCHRIRHYSDAS